MLSILVFVLLATLVLPHTGGARGLDVLIGSEAATEAGVALPSRVFAWFSLVFGVGFSMLALLTRRWAMAWIALAGSTVSAFLGLLAVWSRQTAPEPYPGPGLGPGHRLARGDPAQLPLGAGGRGPAPPCSWPPRRSVAASSAKASRRALLESFPDEGDDAAPPKN